MDNLNNLTDEQLEEIISRAENTHVDGSQYLKAKNTLEVRRNKKLFVLQIESLKQQNRANLHQANSNKIQQSILQTAQSRLDRIIKLLDRPLWIVILASLWGVFIGVAVNVGTAFLCSFIHCQSLQ